ncbi:MAG TPA: hypothetical protein VF758_06785 [Candidatus Acidoferrum sp.]
MKQMVAFFEIVISAIMLGGGFYFLNEGSSNKASSEAGLLIVGAVCIALGAMAMAAAMKAILWHRHMLRNMAAHHRLGKPASEHHRGI